MPSNIPDNKTRTVIVIGATSLIGHFLLSRLNVTGYSVIPLSRSKVSSNEYNWHHFDGSLQTITPAIEEPETLIHLGPLRVLPGLISEFSDLGGKRIIAFSSTSRFSKLKSSSESERKMAEELMQAEEETAALCKEANIPLTLFRPTLIYGAGLDKNVSSISRFIKRFGFFPVLGGGTGLRQPVHADDLAAACVAVITNEKTFHQSYDLVGGETLTYKQMVEKIFFALNKKPRFIPIPLTLFRLLMKLISLLPGYSHVTPDMANRMNEALNFDSQKAQEDFGYSHRGFSPQQEDLEIDLNYARL
jgi:NAD dependent epimerase/dehydratase family enzyme